MRLSALIVLAIGVVVAGLAGGCVGGGVYRCSSPSQCERERGGRPGMCEADGYCSFPDMTCTSGRRYGGFALQANQCVGGDVDAAPVVDVGPADVMIDAARDGGSVDDAGQCGALGERCCAGATCTGGLGCSSPTDGVCRCHVDLVTRVTHNCIERITDRSVWCWGRDGYNQLGSGASPGPGIPRRANPILLPPLIGAAPGAEHTMVLGADGRVHCVGGNFDGQCGDGTTSSHFGDYVQPQAVSPPGPLTGVTEIGAGRWHSCALAAGVPYCWGANDYAQVGYTTAPSGTPPRPRSLNPGQVTGLTAAESLSVGGYHSCVTKTGGTVYCWGSNGEGQLGVPGGDSTTPAPIPNLTGAERVLLGIGHSCVLRAGALTCWGNNLDGQLGDGGNNSRHLPAPVQTLPPNVVHASAGGNHTCAVIRDGRLYCWGSNEFKQLGFEDLGGAGGSPLPLQLTHITDALEVAAGDDHTCVLRRSGQVQCWGANSSGQLGISYTTPQSSAPITVQLSCP